MLTLKLLSISGFFEKNPGSLLDATSWISSFLLCFYPYSVASLVTCSIFLPSFPLFPYRSSAEALSCFVQNCYFRENAHSVLWYCISLLRFTLALLPSYNTLFFSSSLFFTRQDLPFPPTREEVLGFWSLGDYFSGYWSRSSLSVTNHSVNCSF